VHLEGNPEIIGNPGTPTRRDPLACPHHIVLVRERNGGSMGTASPLVDIDRTALSSPVLSV